ncbi:hypothetical protein [Chondromyces crocatus]|uniref:DUF2345 domain-containing protein n=1 Tax=Chondromyces crocatus TaxID=52 RepID=A0A0K1EIE8_CHOCO|nr:hypothetical protein [Chondromyces crocatus]AKT40624.1 uncharacterized protein CMC5_047800 [Chondromyces crocatus]
MISRTHDDMPTHDPATPPTEPMAARDGHDAPEATANPAPPTAPTAGVGTLALAQGHTLIVAGGQDRNVLQLVDPSGTANLEISIGPEGIRLLVRGADLALTTTGALAIEAERLSLHGKQGLSLSTEGDARIEASGQLETVGRSQLIRSARGNVRVQANDDVEVAGERIRLNS